MTKLRTNEFVLNLGIIRDALEVLADVSLQSLVLSYSYSTHGLTTVSSSKKVHLLPGTEFSANIPHLQNTIDLVSQWMSDNLLSLNQSKTEFLLIIVCLLNYLKSSSDDLILLF